MSGFTRITVRLPDGLYERLTASAKSSHRSLSAEMVFRLEFLEGFVPPAASLPAGKALRDTAEAESRRVADASSWTLEFKKDDPRLDAVRWGARRALNEPFEDPA